jgi:uncharacterized protein (TIGR02147 family)
MEGDNENNFCQIFLQREYGLRKAKNSLYSIRALARDLGVSKTTVSDVLGGKRTPSPKNLDKILDKLNLSADEHDQIHVQLKKKKLPAQEMERLQMQNDTFRLIADWYYLAILNLAKIKKNKGNAQWVSERLAIGVEEAKNALEMLKRLGLIEIKRGKMTRTSLPLSTTRDIPSEALKLHHHNNLQLAGESLHLDPVESREFSSVTMAIDPKQLPQAKELLMKTKRKVAKILETDNPSEVYTLSFQLFPLTKKEGLS